MDDHQVRNLGIVGGGAALVVALGLAVLGGGKTDGAIEPAVDPPEVAASTVSPTPSVSATASIPSVEAALADGPPPMAVVKPAPTKTTGPPQNPNLEFLVRFDERHPMSRAQALWLQGKHDDAEALARATLPQRAELRGLCFSRFTLGAEIVFAHCDRVPRAQLARTSERWLRKIRAVRGVQYADANVALDVESK